MHVRVDSGLYAGYKVPPYYDSMIGKLIVYGIDRESCIRRLKRALEEFVVEGMKTTVPLHQRIIATDAFKSRRLYDQMAGTLARREQGSGRGGIAASISGPARFTGHARIQRRTDPARQGEGYRRSCRSSMR